MMGNPIKEIKRIASDLDPTTVINKAVDSIDLGSVIDAGGKVAKEFKNLSENETLRKIGDTTEGLLRDAIDDPMDHLLTSLDPAGIFYDAKGEHTSALQGNADVFNIGANPRDEAAAAEEEAVRQQELIDAENAELEEERARAAAAEAERLARLKGNSLLVGGETGATGLLESTAT